MKKTGDGQLQQGWQRQSQLHAGMAQTKSFKSEDGTDKVSSIGDGRDRDSYIREWHKLSYIVDGTDKVSYIRDGRDRVSYIRGWHKVSYIRGWHKDSYIWGWHRQSQLYLGMAHTKSVTFSV